MPPNQAELMVGALRRKACRWRTSRLEQHGFRKATIQTVLRAELAFYGRVFGFEPADGLADLVIDTLSTSPQEAPARTPRRAMLSGSMPCGSSCPTTTAPESAAHSDYRCIHRVAPTRPRRHRR